MIWCLFASIIFCTNIIRTESKRHEKRDNCKSPKNVWDTMVVYGFDDIFDSATTPFFTEMPSRRNTVTFRERAYGYFSNAFGLIYDPAISTPQTPTNIDIPLTVSPLILNPDAVTMRVWGFNDVFNGLDFKHPEHRFPVSNTIIEDIVYFASPTESITWKNKNPESSFYGNEFTLNPGEAILFGSYRLIVDGIQATNEETDIYYRPSPYGAISAVLIDGGLSCDLESEIYGNGFSLGRFIQIPDENNPSLISAKQRTIMTFPSNIRDQNVDEFERKCREIQLMNDEY